MSATFKSHKSPTRMDAHPVRNHVLRRSGGYVGQVVAYGLAIVICCAAQVTVAAAADAQYSSVEPDQPLKEWLLLGPIPAQEDDADRNVENARRMGLERDLLEKSGGEGEVRPEAGASVEARGGKYEWRHHRVNGDTVDLVNALGPHDFAIAYAAATVESSQEQTQLVGLGSDDGVRVWLNGELVHENAAPRAVVADDDVFPVKLNKGTNRILIKVVNDQGGWGFTWRFLSQTTLAKRLAVAAAEGETEVVEELIPHVEDLDARPYAEITAAQIAKARGYDHLVELLVSKGASSPQPFDTSAVLSATLDEFSPNDAPGVAVLVARDGEVLFSQGFGLADLAHGVAVTPQTKFRIGSVTKQFAAAAILKLQEEGRLSVDDKLSKYFADFSRGDEVTIHHLLTHTSGIKSYTSKPDFMKTVTMPRTSDEMIASFKDDEFDFDPGTQFLYNNSGYFLLGVIVEKVSGKSFDDYLRDTFFKPLEMHNTGVHTATALLKHEATGYEYAEERTKKALDWDMSQAGAAGALYSTVEDLMRWNEGVFTGKVLSDESLEAAFTPVTLDSGEEPMMSYGYGWTIGEHRGLKTISHGGGLNGWSAFLTRYVDQNVTIAVLHNAMPPVPTLNPGDVAELVADLYLWRQMKPRPRYEVDESVDAATLAAYVGQYDYMGAVMDVALEDGQLTAQLTGQARHPIFPMGNDQFFWKVADAQIKFLKDDQGNVVSARHAQGGMSIVAKRLPEEEQVIVEEETLERYVGKYDYSGLGVLTVRRDGKRLLARLTGQPEFEIYPKSENAFFWKVVVAEIQFMAGDDGKVEKAIHRQAGTSIEAKKIE